MGTRVVGIRFRGAGKSYYFDPGNEDYKKGEKVIVETARGMEMGDVSFAPTIVSDEAIKDTLKPILRKATEEDIDSIVKIKIDSWKDTYKGIVSDEFLNSMDYKENFAKFKKEIENENSIKQNYVMTKDDIVIGYAKFSILNNERARCALSAR